MAIGIFEIGSLICGVAPSSSSLIVGRAIAGLGCSGIFSGALLIIAHSVPLDKRPVYAGLASGMFGIASFVGPLLGGAFTDHVSWRWCFYINLPIGGVTIFAIALFFTAPKQNEHLNITFTEKLSKIDLPGLSFFLPGAICILLALQWGGVTYPWNSGRVISLFVVGGACVTVFAILQPIRGENGTLPPRILRNRTTYSAALYSFFIGAAFFILIFYIPIWFQAVKGTSATSSGIHNLALLISLVVAIIISSASVTAVGYYAPFMIFGCVFLSIGAGLLTTWDVETQSSKWIGYQVIAGIGIGVGLQQSLIAVQAALTLDDVPTATAIVVFGQTFGAALALSAVTNVFNNRLVANLVNAVPEIPGISQLVLNAGATEVANVISKAHPEALARVLSAYNDAVVHLFYGSVVLACLGLVPALTMPWISVKRVA
jgi:hypothetical protein